jgi:hypothetical protein
LTAVRLYGAHLGVIDPARAMSGLRSITLGEASPHRQTVLWSVVEIFAEGQSKVVAHSLADWALSPQPTVSRMAAECLAELARLDDAERHPLLLRLYDEEPDLVVRLWQRVLSSGSCGNRPWNALRAWVDRGLDIGGLRSRLEESERLRRPLDFYLGMDG